MNVQTHVSLAPYTTFRIGGVAQFFIEAKSEDDVREAIRFAREKGVPLLTLGGGSNVLVTDSVVDAVVLRVAIPGMVFSEQGDQEQVAVGAGEIWDVLVKEACDRGLFGVENLAAIPGTVGGAAVQNIGAYGAEFSECVEYVEAIDQRDESLLTKRFPKEACHFAYRTSVFKQEPSLIVTSAVLRFSKNGTPRLGYPDLVKLVEAGTKLETPLHIAEAVRAVRARKFPDLSKEGTAGSFFKNPVVSAEKAAELMVRFPEIRQFPQKDGTVKIALAWILDHVLALKGFRMGRVRLFENQPLVIAGDFGATQHEVDALAETVQAKVFSETGIMIEREVESFPGENFFRNI